MSEFEELDFHLMNDNKPSLYLNDLRKSGLLDKVYPLTLLGDLTKVPQSTEFHPEGNVWNHTILVTDNAAQRRYLSKNPRVFMWAALLHDLGKAPTTKFRRGKITSYDHDKWGENLSIKFLKEFTDDSEFIKKVSVLVRWHMQILFVVKGLPFADIKKMASQVSTNEIALLGLCDRLGRGGMTDEKMRDEEKSIELFKKKCQEQLLEKNNILV